MAVYENANAVMHEVGKMHESANGVTYEVGKVHEVNAGGVLHEIYSADLRVVANPTDFPISEYKALGGAAIAFSEGTRPYASCGFNQNEGVLKGIYITLDVSGFSNCLFRLTFRQWAGLGQNKLSAGYSFSTSVNYTNIYQYWNGNYETYITKNIDVSGQKVLTLFVGCHGQPTQSPSGVTAYIDEILLT